MKTLLILILAAALAGGAWLSKPSEQSFREMVQRRAAAEQEKKDKGLIQMVFGKKNGKGKPEQFLSNCTYKDRVLWSTVERDGKTIYTGVFNTWFPSDMGIERAQL
jgi:hypothetical protein